MKSRRKTSSGEHFRGVERTLSVIRAFNESGAASISEVARATGIPRPSLYRILNALCGLGYLRRQTNDKCRYELTLLVRTLSDGAGDETWVHGVAEPVMEALQRDIVWPTDLASFSGNRMVIRATTRRHSPLTIDTVTAGVRLPILYSASGRAFLAFCEDVERETILSNLRRSTARDDEIASDERFIRRLLSKTRTNGYGGRAGGEIYKKTGSISVPIFQSGHVLACLGISFIASALSPEEAASRYLVQLRDAAAAIERGCAA